MTLDALHAGLSAYLARHVPELAGPPLGKLVELRGGWASALFTCTVSSGGASGTGSATVVLKLYAPDAGGRQHATREWRALTHVRAIGYPVPAVIAFEPDPGHLGRPFIVMEHIAGASFWSAVESADQDRQVSLVQAFTERLVALHALAPHRLEPAAARTSPHSALHGELARLRRDCTSSPHPALLDVVAWLDERSDLVTCGRPVILHRDYHPWNVMVDAADRLWVLDWDWRVGDARFDLAWTCTLMQRSGHRAFARAVQEEYARRTGDPLDEFAYFEVLTTLRWLLNVLPAIGPDSRLGASARADFRSFLVEPVHQATALLGERTGTTATLRV